MTARERAAEQAHGQDGAGSGRPQSGPSESSGGCERHREEPHNLCPACWECEPDFGRSPDSTTGDVSSPPESALCARCVSLQEALQRTLDLIRAAPDWPATDKEYGVWLVSARRFARAALAASEKDENPGAGRARRSGGEQA